MSACLEHRRDGRRRPASCEQQTRTRMPAVTASNPLDALGIDAGVVPSPVDGPQHVPARLCQDGSDRAGEM